MGWTWIVLPGAIIWLAVIVLPMLLGGRPESRGVVASCSYGARQFGIHSAMPMARAVRQCPGLIIVPSRYGAYEAASRQVMARLHQLTPLVEQLSIDEAFLDVSDLPARAELIARQLQTTINQELGLPCSLGVAANKLVAKVASRLVKPQGEYIVAPGDEQSFLAPLPVWLIPGIEGPDLNRLQGFNLNRVHQVTGLDSSSEMIREAQKRNQGTFFNLSFTEIGQLDKPFDCIYCIGNSLHTRSLYRSSVYNRHVSHSL